MKTLEDIKDDLEIVNDIDWDMTPEEAVTLYLEWGNNWSHGKMVRSKDDVSYYFVVNTWEDDPGTYLIRRNSEEAIELARIDIPEALRSRLLMGTADRKGVYALNDEVKQWLKDELSVGGHCSAGTVRCAHRRKRDGVNVELKA